MQALFVSPGDSRADATSLTTALRRAQPDDVVLVGPGRYAPSLTGESVPIRVPPGVHLEGAGKEECVIDGEGQCTPSFNPIRPDQSVVVIEDGASLSEVTVTNGGGHGIGVPPAACVTITSCDISRHGDHGIFLCGVTEALVTGCVFSDNGRARFEPALPRGVGARQGHHIFAEAQSGQQNRLRITDNVMQRCFTDGLAFICFFPQDDGVSFEAVVLRNTIEDCERGGLLFSCSFGPASNRLSFLVSDNRLQGNKQFGINILTAIPLAEKIPQHSQLTGVISRNRISHSPIGIAVQTAVGEAHHNKCRVVIDRNEIFDWKTNAIRLVSASGLDDVETQENTLSAVVSRNTLNGDSPAVVVQGAGGTAKSKPSQNSVSVRFLANDIEGAGNQPILISNGPADNRAEVDDRSDPYTRTDDDLLS